jgi:hypothetical protein
VETKERRERELREAKESMAREEAVHTAFAAKEADFARQTARMDRELAVQDGDEAAAAAATTEAVDEDEDESDDESSSKKKNTKKGAKRTSSGLGLEADAVDE